MEFLHAVREFSNEESDAGGVTTFVLEKARFHEAVDMLACRFVPALNSLVGFAVMVLWVYEAEGCGLLVLLSGLGR